MRLRILLAAVCAIFAIACSKDSGSASASLTIKATEADWHKSNQFLTVHASGDWMLSLLFEGQSENDFSPWAYFGKYTDVDSTVMFGQGDETMIQFNWTGNKSPDSRTAIVTITSGNASTHYSFTQRGSSQSDTAKILASDILGDWMELPQTNVPGIYYYTHPMSVGGYKTRNYSYGWDPDNLVALWVAYPLNASTIGSGYRTNEWGLDPKVPRKYQPVLYWAFSGYYNRGHQCPSADRLTYEYNVSTFYGVNMTPQKSSLNTKAWGTLEGMVRNWARKFDTLYVVTGCTVEGSTKKAYDNEGKAVTVPTGYYKALLGYKKNGTVADTGSNLGYTGIAFYFNHDEYGQSTTEVMKQAITIRELEDEVDTDFFVKLGRDFPTISNKVETTVSDWWSKNI